MRSWISVHASLHEQACPTRYRAHIEDLTHFAQVLCEKQFSEVSDSDKGGVKDMQADLYERSVWPFLSIWIQPRRTIRRIVDSNPGKYVVVLAMLAGIEQVLGRAAWRSLGDYLSLAAILGISFIFGPIFGVISLYIGGVLYRWSGSWIGGRASSEEVRAAMAWSSIPTICTLPLWILELLIFGEELFTSSTPRIDANPFLFIILLPLAVIELILSVWAFVLLLQSLGEVHQFSAWKALASLILGTLVIVVPLLCLAGVIIGISSLQ